MTDEQRIPWKRLSVEAAAIVASILLAFAIDAWWQERAEQAELRNQQQALLQEFLSNRRSLDISVRIHELVVERTDDFLNAIRIVPDGQVAYVSAEVISLTLVTPTFDPSTGGFQTLVASGGLARVGTNELRIELASWGSTVADAAEDERAAVAFVEGQLIPYLRTRIDLTEILRFRIKLDEDQFPGFFAGSRKPDPLPVVHSRELANLLTRRYQHGRLALGALRRVSDQLDSVLDHLAAETETEVSHELGSPTERK